MIAHRRLQAALDEVGKPFSRVVCTCKRDVATVHADGTIICATHVSWNTPVGRDILDAAKAGGHVDRGGYTVDLEDDERPVDWAWAIVAPGEPLPGSVECGHCHRTHVDVDWACVRRVARTKKIVSITPQRSRPL